MKPIKLHNSLNLKLLTAFTLIEVMIGMLIISSVLIIGFSAYSRVGFGKISLMEQTNMQKDSFYFSERLFQLVKEGGSIDYEEYFNRKIIGTGVTTLTETLTETSSGHYSNQSGFGNFGYNGGGFYYCRSGNGSSNKMLSEGCYKDSVLNTEGINFLDTNLSLQQKQQRYGQYSFQFIDYNSNYNDDGGDENGDGEIIGDDDDEFLGVGPAVFGPGDDVKELYLLSGDKRHRTYIRWNINVDEEYPYKDESSIVACNPLNEANKEGCRGTIEFLKLEGVDWGMDHKKSSDKDNIKEDEDKTENDGVIDTWLIDKQFVNSYSGSILGECEIKVSDIEKRVIAGCVNMDDFRQPLFPTSINVTSFKVFVYPNIDYNNAWKAPSQDSNLSPYISPYVILNYKIKPSREAKRKIKVGEKEININSTINLTDIFSR